MEDWRELDEEWMVLRSGDESDVNDINHINDMVVLRTRKKKEGKQSNPEIYDKDGIWTHAVRTTAA